MTTGRIVYTGIEDLTVGLGCGADVFHVRSHAHAELDDLNAGAGNDTLLIETIAGTTAINGEIGDDTARRSTRCPASRPAPTASTPTR